MTDRSRLDGVRVLVVEMRTLSGPRGATPAAALTVYTAAAEHHASVFRAGFQCHVAKPIGVRSPSASWPFWP